VLNQGPVKNKKQSAISRRSWTREEICINDSVWCHKSQNRARAKWYGTTERISNEFCLTQAKNFCEKREQVLSLNKQI
jgi:hypothetical protein